ncbi:DUF5707 domain-containing protein [Streptomyces sp. NPDC001759]
MSTRAGTGGCSTARRAAAAGDRDGSLALEMAGAESAVCKPSGADTARCTYKVTVSRADADLAPEIRAETNRHELPAGAPRPTLIIILDPW